jgi:retinol dehydrogenase 12
VVDLDEPLMERHYDPILAFRRAMFCVVTFTHEFARRLEGTPVSVNALHPGSVETASLRRLRAIDAAQQGRVSAGRYPDVAPTADGARLPMHLALSAEAAGVSGKYFVGSGPIRAAEESYDTRLADRLWRLSETLAAR